MMPSALPNRSLLRGRIAAAGLAVAVAGFAPAGAAYAAGGATSTTAPPPPVPELEAVQPGPSGFYEYSLAPGQTQSASVVVANPSGTQTATFDVYPTDATTSTATGVVYGGLGATPTQTGSWLSVGASTLQLGPGQSRTVPFTVKVPAGTVPGDHVAAVAAQNPATTTQSASGQGSKSVGFSLQVSTRVVIAVVVHVPGPASPGLTLGPPRIHAENGVRQVVDLPMDGTGRLLIKPHLAANLANCTTGAVVASLDRQLDTFVPGTSIIYQWPLGNTVLPPGCYRLVATATLPPQGLTLSSVRGTVQVTSAEAQVHPVAGARPGTVTPAYKAGVNRVVVAVAGGFLALLVAWLLLLAWWRSRRRRRQLEEELARLTAAGQR